MPNFTILIRTLFISILLFTGLYLAVNALFG